MYSQVQLHIYDFEPGFDVGVASLIGHEHGIITGRTILALHCRHPIRTYRKGGYYLT